MKTRSLLLSLALTFSAAAPLIASAQQAPAPPAAAGQHMHEHGMMMHRMFRGVNLTAAQKTQIQQLMTQFHQQHPKGSQPDPQARKAMHDQIMNVLTPAQQAQVKANMAQMHDRAGHPDHDGDAAPAPQATP